MAVWVIILRFMGDLPQPTFTSGVGDVKVRQCVVFYRSDILFAEFTYEWLSYKENHV